MAVLANGRLRWSSPLIFNDPFDVPREIAHGYSAKDVSVAVADFFDAAIENPPEDLTDFDPTLKQILTLARNGFPEELKAEMRKVTQEARQDANSVALDDLRRHWRATVPTLRILCLTESPRHVAMWYHYADKYRGVVLGFRCTDELDSGFLVARPVEYLAQKPAVYTDQGLASLICLTSMAASRKLTELAVYTKSEDWSYEKEWRILFYADDGDAGLHSDLPFLREDLAFVYLGPSIGDEDADAITALACNYPQVEIYRTAIGLDRELHFSLIG